MARQQMFGAVLGTLAELAAASPLLLVLEDLHWADATTRHLLTFLGMLHRERIAIVGTYRTDDLHRRHPLGEVVAELGRLPSVTLVELGPLPAAALAEHLSNLPNGPSRLSTALLSSLVDRAEGNAYYAEACLPPRRARRVRCPPASPRCCSPGWRGCPARRSRSCGQRPWPGGARTTSWSSRLPALTTPTYEEAVRELVAHQLLVPDGPDGYRFRHALLREAVYGDLLPGERTRLHGRFAALLADVPGAAAELAYHSLTSHDVPGALAASVRAGRGSRADRRARRGPPALRPGPRAVGPGGGRGEAGGDEPRRAWPQVRPRGRGERRRAARDPAAAPHPGGGARRGRDRGVPCQDGRAARVLPAPVR